MYESKEITKKVYNTFTFTFPIQCHTIIKMETIIINSENSKTSEPHVLILKLTDKLDLRIGEKSIALSNLIIYYTWENIKSSYNNNKFRISTPTWNNKFELLMDRILYQIFKITLSIFLKSMEKTSIIHQQEYM